MGNSNWFDDESLISFKDPTLASNNESENRISVMNCSTHNQKALRNAFLNSTTKLRSARKFKSIDNIKFTWEECVQECFFRDKMKKILIIGGAGYIGRVLINKFNKSNLDLMIMTKKTVKVNDQVDIGLGWHIINSEKSDNKWHWHNGGTGGYTSSMVIDIKNLVGVIVLSNVSAFNEFEGNVDQLCFELMKTLKDVNGVLYYE